MPHSSQGLAVLFVCLAWLGGSGCVPFVMWEQRTINYRDPSQLPKAHIPEVPPPRTVADPQPEGPLQPLSLDEAIRIALANTRVVRVLVGVSAVNSGQTIYDPAISNTVIDQEQARFDPRVSVRNTWDHDERPDAIFDPSDPDGTAITGLDTDSYNLGAVLSKTTITGGTATLSFDDTLERFKPGVFPLNPRNEHTLNLGYTQPLLQGGGIGPNLAPIVIARINTERSYFQLKDAVQASVRGVIEAYWELVFARTDLWARQQQVAQGQQAYDRAEAFRREGLGKAPAAQVAQARVALANFKARRISAEANAIQREAALKNILGLPPTGPTIVPITPPSTNRTDVHWDEIVRLAEERRPDLVELKLIILADEQRLRLARNDALPRVDAVSIVGWNGLEGKTLIGTTNSTGGNEFADWTLGVNFSVPLGLRQGRAVLRQQELLLARDRANLNQGLHGAIHNLATSTRSLAQFREEYEAFKEARAAARINIEQQAAGFRAGRVIFLDVLQAITDWGNAVSFEAQALTRYNTELANLEQQTGTILETHGVFFFEERFASIGPLGCLARPHDYPASNPPSPNIDLYPTMPKAAENFFDLQSPTIRRTDLPILPQLPERVEPLPAP
jgi:outer membrane protein TolC